MLIVSWSKTYLFVSWKSLYCKQIRHDCGQHYKSERRLFALNRKKEKNKSRYLKVKASGFMKQWRIRRPTNIKGKEKSRCKCLCFPNLKLLICEAIKKKMTKTVFLKWINSIFEKSNAHRQVIKDVYLFRKYYFVKLRKFSLWDSLTKRLFYLANNNLVKERFYMLKILLFQIMRRVLSYIYIRFEEKKHYTQTSQNYSSQQTSE